MSKDASNRVDMTRGVYRRVYAGFVDGERINRLTWMAEAWFWRVMVQADDFGNMKYVPHVLAVQASPRRPVSAAECDEMVKEIVSVGLARLYTVGSETFLHFADWELNQPAPRNGRRIARCPSYTGQDANMGNPGESGLIRGNPGESGGIRINPGELHAPIPIPIPNPTPIPKPTPSETGGVFNDGVNTPVDSICQAIERGFIDKQGNSLAGAGEMYQARSRLEILLRDPWRDGTCADFAPQLAELITTQRFASVRAAVNFIESVCRRCRRDDCLPGDPMKGGKGLVIQRESEPEVSDVWSKVK